MVTAELGAAEPQSSDPRETIAMAEPHRSARLKPRWLVELHGRVDVGNDVADHGLSEPQAAALAGALMRHAQHRTTGDQRRAEREIVLESQLDEIGGRARSRGHRFGFDPWRR
jgi:hypothetical protein